MVYVDDAVTQRANLDYIRAAMRQPMLEREHEFTLAQRWHDHGEPEALHALVRSYAKLVVSIAKRFRHYGLSASDLIQEGNVGLMQAATRFEPDRDVRFSTYAAWWIRSAMQEYILRNWSIVRTGTTAAQKTLFFNLRRLRSQIERNGQPLSDSGRQWIAETLKVPLSEVRDMEIRLTSADQSLNQPMREVGDDEWQDFLPDGAPNPEDIVIGRRDTPKHARWLAEAISSLSPREQQIIRQRRLKDDAATLEDLGKTLGVSKERVRQLEQRALLKLRASMLSKAAEPSDLMLGV